MNFFSLLAHLFEATEATIVCQVWQRRRHKQRMWQAALLSMRPYGDRGRVHAATPCCNGWSLKAAEALHQAGMQRGRRTSAHQEFFYAEIS